MLSSDRERQLAICLLATKMRKPQHVNSVMSLGLFRTTVQKCCSLLGKMTIDCGQKAWKVNDYRLGKYLQSKDSHLHCSIEYLPRDLNSKLTIVLCQEGVRSSQFFQKIDQTLGYSFPSINKINHQISIFHDTAISKIQQKSDFVYWLLDGLCSFIILKMILIGLQSGFVINKMREQDLDEQAIFQQFTEARARQIKEQGIKFQYQYSQYQLLRTGYFSFSKAYEKLNALRDQKKCLAVFSTRGTWISNVQPFEVRIKDENGLFAIETAQLQAKLTNGFSYYIDLFRNASDIGFRLALSKELSRYVPRQYNCEVLDFIKGKIDQLEMDQIYEFQLQGLLNNSSQEEIVRSSGRNRLMIIQGAAGVGKSLVGTLIATKYAEKGKKVLMTAVTKQASKAISEHMTHSLSLNHDHLLHYQFLKYIKAIVKVKTSITKQSKQQEIINILDRQIKTIVGRLMIEKINFLFFNSLITIDEYFTIQPYIRFYTFNTQLIINLLRVTEFNANVLDIIVVLNKIANIKFVDDRWKRHYQEAVRLTIRDADIVVTHTAMVGEINKYQRQGEQFRPYLTIFDEAGQATLQNAYSIFKLGLSNLIIIGDEKQLKPRQRGLQDIKKTLFTILKDNNQVPIFRLTDQFRMNKAINDLVSYVSYQEGEMNYQYKGDVHISTKDFFCEYPLFMVDHNEFQQIPAEHESEDGFYNEHEIKMIRVYMNGFSDHQLSNVGIVTLYRAQVKRLKKEFAQEVKLGLSINTIEGYQGSGKDHILFSVVRSNKKGKIGGAINRDGITVALSRARKGLIIFGNRMTLLNAGYYDNPWLKIIHYLGYIGKIYSLDDELTQFVEQTYQNKLQRDTTQQFDFGQQFDEEEVNMQYEDLEEARNIFIREDQHNETVALPFIERNNY